MVLKRGKGNDKDKDNGGEKKVDGMWKTQTTKTDR